MAGISDAGESAEAWFCRLTGATRVARGSRGDAVLDGVLLEIKDASGGTINQARPVRGMPLVVWSNGVWYVVPVRKLVVLAVGKDRGQHTESALECMAIPLRDVEDCVCAESDLRCEVSKAAADEVLRTALGTCMSEMRSQVDRHRQYLRGVLGIPVQGHLFARTGS